MTLAQAIERHKAAQAAWDVAKDTAKGEDWPSPVRLKEDDALRDLATTPCASDAEFFEKLRYLVSPEARKYAAPEFGPIAVAVQVHFDPDSSALTRMEGA
jgi:hypothetical protein